MKKSNILFFAILWSFNVSAQSPQIQWQKSLGGTDDEGANSIIQTFNGGYIVAGYSKSNDGDVTGNNGDKDYWIAKLDAIGSIEWQKSLGGTGEDIATSIIQTYDSGYVVAGYSNSNDGDVTGNHGDLDYWVVKINAVGTVEWQKSLGGTSWDFTYSIIQTSDSGYVVAGSSDSNDGDVTGNHGLADDWIVKLNASGNIQWQKCLGGTYDEVAFSIVQTYYNGYVIAGSTYSNDGDVTNYHDSVDYWVVKINASGTIEWQKSLGGTSLDFATSIIQTYDSGYVVSGYSQSNDGDVMGNHGSEDYWVAKLNSTGNIQWLKCLGGTGIDEAYSITQTSDSAYVVAGWTDSNDGDVTGNHGYGEYWVAKLNALGNIEWQKCLGGTDSEAASSIIQASDSGYVIAGFSASNDGDVSGNHGISDYWVVKLGVATSIEYLTAADGFHVYPNPVTNNFSISANSEFDNAQLNIFNAMGCNVYSCRLNRETKVIDTENFCSGIYYLQIIKGKKMWAEKIIKQ